MERFSRSKSIVDIRLYFSVIKETMKLESIRYPKPKHYGKWMIVYAYEDLIINKMPYDEWRCKWYFDRL